MNFEKVYEANYEKAVKAAMGVCSGARDIAEDAVQQAATEFLEGSRDQITPALFIRRVVDRARDAMRPRGRRHGDKGPAIEVPMGTALDLDRALYGAPDDEN